MDVLVLVLCHVAQIGEDYEPGEEAGQGVDGRSDETVSENDAVTRTNFVVRGRYQLGSYREVPTWQLWVGTNLAVIGRYQIGSYGKVPTWQL